MDRILDRVNGPGDLSELSVTELERLAQEVRELIIEVVSKNRGHLASNLGVVELAIALHRCFDFLHDRLVWDVGHQGYAHKILTGRKDRFHTLRQKGGVSGFVDRRESPYDAFSFGHIGTSISAALGLACGDEAQGRKRHVVAVIGDGAVASGMPFEAMNHAGALGRNLLLVLNDNTMSISKTVGAVGKCLSKIRSSHSYGELKHEMQEVLGMLPFLGPRFEKVIDRLGEGVQAALTPGGLFVELGFHYHGPVDGHDIEELIATFEQVKRISGPVLVHVITEKGHGFGPACDDPVRFHSSARFEMADGSIRVESGGRGYSRAFGDALIELAREDERIVAITAAMPDGTGLREFAERWPRRYHDVGICEQHATGLAGGLAAAGMKPVFAVYSTFLQRAVDQLFHDVSLQQAPVVFCIDRAGLVGNDGASHHGLFDIAYCRTLPGFVVMAPRNESELRRMLACALELDAPCAIRYPREDVPPEDDVPAGEELAVGCAELCREGREAAIIAYGAMVERALEAARILSRTHGLEPTVVNARFAKPLDARLICDVVSQHRAVVVAEDHALAGGFGSAVLELLCSCGVSAAHVECAGVPDTLVAHASREESLNELGLDAEGLAERVRRALEGPPPA